MSAVQEQLHRRGLYPAGGGQVHVGSAPQPRSNGFQEGFRMDLEW